MSTCFDMSLRDIDSANMLSLKKTIDLTDEKKSAWKRIMLKLLYKQTNTESVCSN